MHPDHAGRPLAPRPRPHVPAAASLIFAFLALAPSAGCAPDDAEPGARGDDTRAGSPSLRAEAERLGDTTALVVTDGAGRTVTLGAPARRIVSMMPSVTEWVIAMGAVDRLAARTDYDDHAAVADLPSVGGGLTPSVEWLAARKPDLVVAWPDAPSRTLVARLEALGIPVYAAPSETIDQGLSTARDLGTLTGRDSAAATAIAEVEAGLDSTAAAVDGRARPSVLFLIGLDPLMAAGPGTFVDQLLERAGGRNVLSDLDILWPQLSLEEVVRRAPEIIIVAAAGELDPGARLAGRPGWRDVPAVAAGRVHDVDPNLVNRPGPRMDEAAATLARLIHGPIPGLPSTRDPRLDGGPGPDDVPDTGSGADAP